MATSRDSDEPTPNGGVRSTIYFTDDAGEPADESVATRAVIVEYDAKGESIHRTYATLDKEGAP